MDTNSIIKTAYHASVLTAGMFLSSFIIKKVKKELKEYIETAQESDEVEDNETEFEDIDPKQQEKPLFSLYNSNIIIPLLWL